MNFGIIKNRNYSFFVFGQAISVMGTVFLNVSLALYVLKITGSASKFASILAIEVIPRILLSPITGTIVEKIDRKKMIVYLDLIRGVFSVGLFVFSLVHPINIWLVYVIVIFYSICQTFFSPASIKILPGILNKEELVDGNSMQNTINEIVLVASPVLSTLLFGITGIGVILLIDGFTYFIGAIASSLINIASQQSNPQKSSFIGNIIEGFKIIFVDIRITSLICNGIVTHVFLFPFALVGFPYMIITLLGGKNVDYGFAQSVASLGSIMAIIFVGFAKKRFNIAQCIGIGIVSMLIYVTSMVPLLIPSVVDSFTGNSNLIRIFFSGTFFVLNLTYGFYVVFYVSFYQATIPDEYLSRYVSFQTLFFALGRILGLKLYGYLFDNYSLAIPVCILLFGMILKLIIHIPFLEKTKKMEAI